MQQDRPIGHDGHGFWMSISKHVQIFLGKAHRPSQYDLLIDRNRKSSVLFKNPLQDSHGVAARFVRYGVHQRLSLRKKAHKIVTATFVRQIEFVNGFDQAHNAAELGIPNDVPRRACDDAHAPVEAKKLDKTLKKFLEAKLRIYNIEEHVYADEGREEEHGRAVLLGDLGRGRVEERQGASLKLRRLVAILISRRAFRRDETEMGSSKGQQLVHEEWRG